MKNTMKMVAAAVLAVGAFVSSNAFAQGNTSTGNVGVYSRIITPIKVTPGEEMNFGAWYGGTAGTLTVNPDNGNGTQSNSLVAQTGGLIQVNIAGANSAANNDVLDQDPVEEGSLTVSGEQGFYYDIDATGSGLGTGMAFTSLIFRHQGTGSAQTTPSVDGKVPGSTVGATGSDAWNVGASVSVAANTTPGRHDGSIAVTASYE